MNVFFFYYLYCPPQPPPINLTKLVSRLIVNVQIMLLIYYILCTFNNSFKKLDNVDTGVFRASNFLNVHEIYFDFKCYRSLSVGLVISVDYWWTTNMALRGVDEVSFISFI